LNSHTDASLVTSCKVVGQPGDDTWEGWVDGTGRDKDTAVDDLGVAGGNTPEKESALGFEWSRENSH
jgi:hypothetical protein